MPLADSQRLLHLLDHPNGGRRMKKSRFVVMVGLLLGAGAGCAVYPTGYDYYAYGGQGYYSGYPAVGYWYPPGAYARYYTPQLYFQTQLWNYYPRSYYYRYFAAPPPLRRGIPLPPRPPVGVPLPPPPRVPMGAPGGFVSPPPQAFPGYRAPGPEGQRPRFAPPPQRPGQHPDRGPPDKSRRPQGGP